MKSIRISHSVKNVIKEYDDGSYDDNVNQLISLVEDYMPVVDVSDDSSTVVSLKEDTVDKLESYRLTNGESLDNVIVRMLVLAQALNSSDE